MPTFDVTSEVDMQEVRNAVDQAAREVSQRYDFKMMPARTILGRLREICEGEGAQIPEPPQKTAPEIACRPTALQAIVQI